MTWHRRSLLVFVVLLGFELLPTWAGPIDLVASDLRVPFGVDIDKGGNAFVVEYEGHRVLHIDTDGNVSVIAGTGEKGYGDDGGLATKAQFSGMHGLALGADGYIYIADTWNNRVRKIVPKTGIVTTFAGTGQKGFGGDGDVANKATFGNVYAVAFDPKFERLYLADLDNRRIRVIDMKTRIVTTVAGNGKRGVPEDGAEAKAAPLVDPRAVAADAKGNVYVLERGGHALRVVDASGKIRTVAGTGKGGYSGDGGDALKAQLKGPKHICIDGDGNVLIADADNHAIRKYVPATGKIVTIAGTGKQGSSGVGGPPEKCQLNQPHGVWVQANGDLYIADSNNNRVLRVKR